MSAADGSSISTIAPPSPLPPPEHTSMPLRRTAFLSACAPGIIVFLMFALFATLRTPIPAANEPHYLSKARHLWNQDWCSRDLFLQSENAHAVFLTLIGTVTRWLSLEQTAWLGRLLVWSALAWGFTRLVSRLVPTRWSPVWVACGFLGLQAIGNFSGEWVIGGVEGKGFAYAALFGAFALLPVGRWIAAGICLGLAVSLHPVVGVWGGLTMAFALLVARLTGESDHDPQLSPTRRNLAALGIAAGLCALPGLIPAIVMLWDSPSAEMARAADKLQVFGRLSHHLNPAQFSRYAYMGYALLTVVWLGLIVTRPRSQRSPATRYFDRIVFASGLIALGGMVAAYGLHSASLLKFYPFRLFDALLPLAVVVGFVQRAMPAPGAASESPRSGGSAQQLFARFQTVAILGTCLGSYLMAVVDLPAYRYPFGISARNRVNWIDVCHWVRTHTPEDALFLTPRFNFAFKWYAQRAEYVAWKDCPQDAVSLLEWQRRLDLVHRWRIAHFQQGFDAAAVGELQQAINVDYIVAWNNPSADPYRGLPVLYRNESFVVLRAPPAD